MNIGDLVGGEQRDSLPCTLQTLSQILPGFLFRIGLQLDDVKAFAFDIALQVGTHLIETIEQRWLSEQEYMRTPFRRSRSKTQQRFERRIAKLFRIVNQQVDFLTGQPELHDLRQDRLHFSLGDAQRLRDLLQHARSIAGTARRNHDTLHRLLVGTRHQRLAQQGLAAALRPGDRQQQLAVARQMMKLTQHRLALGRKEFEARYPRRKGVMTQLIMAEEGLVGMQTSHGVSVNL